MTKGKILVVDDDRLVLATLTHGLTEAGYQVIDADNGDDAILLAREHRPDLALLDIRMEGKSGFDVAAYLREAHRTPFMFLSAFSDEATVGRVRELGAVAYLVKPVDIRQIVPAVERAFRERTAQPPVAPPHPRAEAAPAGKDALAQPVSLAVGILMHRYSLDRQAAFDRLERMSASAASTLEAQAERLVQAVELLSGAGREER